MNERIDAKRPCNDTSRKGKMVMKGRAAVDEGCPVAPIAHVLEEGDEIWTCTLNQVRR